MVYRCDGRNRKFNRTYTGYDKTLKTGPYNFGWANTRENWVEKFPYQNGLLVWFSNGEYTNNNTSAHPGAGLILPVDARPKAIKFPGTPGGGGRSLYWVWPRLSRHFHCASAGRAIRLAARTASKATSGRAMVVMHRVKNWRAV